MLSRPTSVRERPPSREAEWAARINPQMHLAWSGAWRPGTIEPARILTDHELVLVGSGRCTVEVGQTTHRLAAGEWLVVPPGVAHASRTTADSGCVRHCVHFDWDWCGPIPAGPPWTWLPETPRASALRPAPDFVPGSAAGGTLHGTALPDALHLAERLHLAWRGGVLRNVRLLLLELLLRLIAPQQVAAEPDARAELARQAKDILDQRTDLRFRLREEFAPLGVSYEHLCRCFTRAYGVSPMHYLQIARVEHAKRLLVESSDPLPQIAEAAGFGDAGALASCFRRTTGLSPGTWRRRHTA